MTESIKEFKELYVLLMNDLHIFRAGLYEEGLEDDADALGEILLEAPPTRLLGN